MRHLLIVICMVQQLASLLAAVPVVWLLLLLLLLLLLPSHGLCKIVLLPLLPLLSAHLSTKLHHERCL